MNDKEAPHIASEMSRLAFRCGARLGIMWGMKRKTAAPLTRDGMEAALVRLWDIHKEPDREAIDQLFTQEKEGARHNDG